MIQTEGPNMPFDKFAREDLWALSSLRAFLFDEYRITQDINKLPKVTVSLLLQFDRHMAAAESTGKITIVKHTDTAFAGIEEPLFHSHELLKELKFRGYPVPNSLIKAIREGDLDKTEELLKKLRGNMNVYLQKKGNINKAELEMLTNANDDGRKEKPLKKLEVAPPTGPAEQKKHNKLTFYRVNKTWLVGLAEIKNIPHTKGMTYYQYLFLNPNKYYPGLDIHILGNKQDINYLKESRIFDDDHKYKPPQDEEEKDSDALKKELRERYQAYKQAEQDETLDCDLLRGEYEDFKKIYNSLYDNRGKVRDDFSPKNKAIKAVAKNLKKAKDNILEYLPELEELLKDVKTGNLFGYIPSNPDKPIKIIIEQ